MVSPLSQNVGVHKVDGEAPHPNVGVGSVDDAKFDDEASPQNISLGGVLLTPKSMVKPLAKMLA